MNRKDRFINKFGLDIKRPKFLVISLLIIILSIEIGLLNNKQEIQDHEVWKNLDALVFVFAWFALLTTPLVEWLRNIYVLVGWLLICMLWYVYKVDQDFLTAVVPFSVLIYSQISRLIFKSIMGYHPIHLLFNQFAVHRYSQFNKRKSTKIDYRYSMIYSVVGMVLSIVIGIITIKK
jgi:hypothetical protein